MSNDGGNNINQGLLTLREIIDISATNGISIINIPDDGDNKGENKSSNEGNIIAEKLKKYFNFDDNNNNPIAIDLKLGNEVFLSSQDRPFNLNEKGEMTYLTIKPGEFALLTTLETLQLPNNMIALISMRFSYKIKGLLNVSGFHVDPQYKGKIIYSVYNAGPNPIPLRYKEKIFTIIFAKLNISSSRENKAFPEIKHIEPKHIAGIMGTPISPQSLAKKVQTLEIWNKAILGVVSGLVVAMLIALLGK